MLKEGEFLTLKTPDLKSFLKTVNIMVSDSSGKRWKVRKKALNSALRDARNAITDSGANAGEARMTKKEKREKTIFDYFEKKNPNFAGRKVTSVLGNDPPDILCTDEADKRIGVELGEWVNKDQIKASKIREAIERSYGDAVQSRKASHPSNIGMVRFGPKDAVQVSAGDAKSFRDEMYAFIEWLNTNWPPSDLKYNPRHYVHHDFSGYPMLAKYLHMLEFIPANVINPPNGYEWIGFRPAGGAYSSESAITALAELIAKKTSKYETLHVKEKLDELYLVAYYDQGLFHNTPYETISTRFEDIAAAASVWLKTNIGKFQKVFLFDSTGDGKTAQIL
jgi:hypothetical protein